MKILVACVLVLIYPISAHAYIDPGIVSVFMQAFFAMAAGLIAAWVIAPWHAIKAFFQRFFKRESTIESAESATVDDVVVVEGKQNQYEQSREN